MIASQSVINPYRTLSTQNIPSCRLRNVNALFRRAYIIAGRNEGIPNPYSSSSSSSSSFTEAELAMKRKTTILQYAKNKTPLKISASSTTRGYLARRIGVSTISEADEEAGDVLSCNNTAYPSYMSGVPGPMVMLLQPTNLSMPLYPSVSDGGGGSGISGSGNATTPVAVSWSSISLSLVEWVDALKGNSGSSDGGSGGGGSVTMNRRTEYKIGSIYFRDISEDTQQVSALMSFALDDTTNLEVILRKWTATSTSPEIIVSPTIPSTGFATVNWSELLVTTYTQYDVYVKNNANTSKSVTITQLMCQYVITNRTI